MKTYGIDVSKWQGAVDWKTVAAALQKANGGGPGFAILRIGTTRAAGGLTLDAKLKANIAGCEANGIPWGAYFYSYDRSVAAAQKSAQGVIAALKGYKPCYPVYMDVEYEPFNTGKDGSGRSRARVKADNTAIIRAALEVLEEAGYFAGIYCSRSFFTTYTNVSELAAYSKWEAAYTGSDTALINNHMWQYSSKNALGVPGFGQSLDCDVCYLDFPAIIRGAGLNGWAKTAADTAGDTPDEAGSAGDAGAANPNDCADWAAPGNDFTVTATPGDREHLRRACAEKQLPVKNA